MRTIDFAYKVLRNGAFFGYLAAPMDGAPTIRASDSSEIKSSLSGVFAPVVTSAQGDVLEPNWLSDEIQPCIIIDGVESPLGSFLVSSSIPTENDSVKSLRIEAFGRCWRVRDTNSRTRLSFASGTNYLTAIETLLTGAGITSASITPTSAVMADAREDWDPGTSYLTVINQLLDEINYNPLHFSRDGLAVLEPASVPTAANIRHKISDDPAEISGGASAIRVDRMLPQISRESDVYNTPNVFVCICANPDKSSTMIASAENTNMQSPLSIPRRGRQIVKITVLDNVASQNELQAYADRQRDMSLIGGETITLAIDLQPDYSVGDVVGLRYGDLNALCIVRALTMDLRIGGTLRLTLERMIYNLD